MTRVALMSAAFFAFWGKCWSRYQEAAFGLVHPGTFEKKKRDNTIAATRLVLQGRVPSSYSWPRVGNDNAFAESTFKTLNTAPASR